MKSVSLGVVRDPQLMVITALTLVFVLITVVPPHLFGANNTWSGTGGATAWTTSGNWSLNLVPTSSDVVQFGAPTPTGNTVGISGTTTRTVQAVEVVAARLNPITIGSSGTTGGSILLQLNGTTVNSIANTVLRNNSGHLLTIQPNNGQATPNTLSVTLGNVVDNVVNIDGSGGITIGVVIAGAGRHLTLGGSGNGALTLSSSNTFSGGVTIGSGTKVNLNNASAIGTGTFTINGGTIDNTSAVAVALSTNNIQSWNGDFAFTGSKDLDLGTGAVTLSGSRQIDVNGGTLTVGGMISGSGFGLAKSGAGTLVLSGSNSYSGATSINSGSLKLGASAVIPDGSSVTLANAAGAALDVNGNTETIASLSGGGSTGGNVQLGSGTLIVGDSNNTNFSGVISGTSGKLIKQGAGSLTLSGTNTYTGVTSVTGGTLLVDGSLANGGVEVYGGATLGGKGTIGVGGGSTVKIGATGTGTGTFSPGASIAVENIVGNLTFGSNGNFACEINSSVSFASGADLVNVSGDISIDPAANLNFSDLASSPVLLDGSGAKYTLISYAGTLTGTFASKPDNSIVTIGSSSFYLRYNDTSPGQNFSGSTLYSKYVTITAVPEASAFLFGTVASILVGGAYVRRKMFGPRTHTSK